MWSGIMSAYGTEYTGKYQIKEDKIETLSGAQKFIHKYAKHIQEWELDFADAYEMEDIMETL